ncbi:TPA: hypothetical protein SAQ55_004700 [Escherichia coli]|nr:hypothetical protein [Escherichia coli]
MNKNNRTGFTHINLPNITGRKISIYRFTKMQAENPEFTATSASGIKKPVARQVFYACFAIVYKNGKVSDLNKI